MPGCSVPKTQNNPCSKEQTQANLTLSADVLPHQSAHGARGGTYRPAVARTHAPTRRKPGRDRGQGQPFADTPMPAHGDSSEIDRCRLHGLRSERKRFPHRYRRRSALRHPENPSTKGWTGAARCTRTTALPSVTANRAWPPAGGLCCRAQGSENRAFANHPESLQVPGLMGNLEKISRPP